MGAQAGLMGTMERNGYKEVWLIHPIGEPEGILLEGQVKVLWPELSFSSTDEACVGVWLDGEALRRNGDGDSRSMAGGSGGVAGSF